MKCGNCGMELAAGAQFCTNCGRRITMPQDIPQTVQQPMLQQMQQPMQQPVQNKKSGMGGIIAAIIAIVFLLILILVLFFILISDSGDDTSATTEATTTEATTTEATTIETTEEQNPPTEERTDGREQQPQDENPPGNANKEPDYIIPDSNERILTDADIAGLDVRQLNYAKNEIYARHGYTFESIELQNYFGSKSWYVPLYTKDEFNRINPLSSTESKNASFLSGKEKALGGYQLDQ